MARHIVAHQSGDAVLEGLLAHLMERGANRWFEAQPRWEDLDGTTDERLDTMLRRTADAMAEHPLFLRLFFMLALEATEDEAASEIVRRVRLRAFEDVQASIIRTLADHAPDLAQAAAQELTTFAVAYFDGCFFAGQLEAGHVDLRRMYADLAIALSALTPAAVARARARSKQAEHPAEHPADHSDGSSHQNEGHRP